MPPLKPLKGNMKKDEKKAAVNLTDPEQRMALIKDKLSTLTRDFGDVYGQRLTEELIKRLEFTINTFHEDILKALDQLQDVGKTQRNLEEQVRQGTPLHDLLPEELKKPGKVLHQPVSDLFKLKIK
ncbi:hypothetical protein FMIA91_04890 [Fidelibacter multiformis]|jgi:molecular chaperone GrpE (heat shock protein)